MDTQSSVNAIAMLVAQHRCMEKMMKDLLDAPIAERKTRFEACAAELMSHVLIEEEIFYPTVKAERTEDILLESLEEHLSLKRVLRDLVTLSPESSHFEPKVHVLDEQMRHHHKEEEDHLFPKVEKLFSTERLEALGGKMRARQEELRRQDPQCLLVGQTRQAADLPA
jgi:hemerythrin superfamily protein